MIYERKCVVCGKTFSTMYPAKICCSVKCARERRKEKSRGYAQKYERKKREEAIAPVKEIARADKHKEIKKILEENSRLRFQKKRVCHDCGKATNDYRCASCWEKLREKHDIPAHGNFGMEEYAN